MSESLPTRLAVLISGSGRTLVNLLAEQEAGRLDIEIPLVIANRDCAGLERAREAGVSCEIIRPKAFASIEDFSAEVFDRCRRAGADLVVLAGFLAKLRIPEDFAGRVMNIHPALIPAFCGQGMYGHLVHEAVLARGCKVSGCTVHLVDNEYDHGPILLQKVVEVRDGDTPDTLAARVFEQECVAYPEAIRQWQRGRQRP
jgi:formyltetrahydrofolate-dependent phosphoribosylglycinamide formyltransferase